MALVARSTTGKGQRMDTSQVGATVQFQQAVLAPVFHNDGTQRDLGTVGADKWIANTYKGSDGKWFLIQPGGLKFLDMLKGLGRDDMAKDERCGPNLPTPQAR